MGKRSRKRLAEGEGSTRAERDARRRERVAAADSTARKQALGRPPRKASFEDRPHALWHPFPLTELLMLAGIVLMVWGFVEGPSDDNSATRKIGAGLAVASIGGLELSIREHVTGFRSHTTLLSGGCGIVTIVVLGLVVGIETFGVLIAAGAVVFGVAFYLLRELFKRRSGGLSFR